MLQTARWHAVAHSYRPDSRNLLKPLLDAVDELHSCYGIRIPPPTEVDSRSDNLSRSNAECLVLQIACGAQQEPCGRKQHQRNAELCDEKNLSGSCTACSGRVAEYAIAQKIARPEWC